MKDQIPENIKKERSAKLIAIQNEIRNELLSNEIGNEYDVLFETQSEGFVGGHTASFIEIKVKTDLQLQGYIHKVKIIGVEDGICAGTLIRERR